MKNKHTHTFIALLMLISSVLPLHSFADTIKKIVFCAEGNPATFAPSVGFNANSIDVYVAIYDTLVTYSRGETTLIPSLAEHWQISKDAKEYTLFLQRGVKWHSNALFTPTRHFNADDVIFTFERQLKTNHPYYRIPNADHSYFKSLGFATLIKSIEKLDDYTVKFILNEPNAGFLTKLSLTVGSIQSLEYATAMLRLETPEIVDTQPIGTGPFSFESYEKDQKILFKTFPDYWRGRSKIDELEFLVTPNASDRWQKLQSNICQVMPFPQLEDLPLMRKHHKVTVLEQVGLNVSYLAYNTTKPPLDDVRVRKALNMAINKQAILDRVYQGRGIAAVNLIPPTMWSYNKAIPADVFDPVAAKKLLQEAGFPNGFTTDLWAMPVARGYNPNPLLMARMIQADLAAINVTAEIKSPDWSNYSKHLARNEHETAVNGWTADYGDPDAFFFPLLSCHSAKSNGPNTARFCNPLFDDLIHRARTIANPTLRIPLYEEAQLIFKEQAPWMTVAHSSQTVVVRNEVLNFRLSPFGRHLFYGVELANTP